VSRPTFLEQIQALDPERDHQRIVYLDACHEFAFDITRALEFALFRTFAVPSIATMLERTGEFVHRAQKRYDDTDLIISELMASGYDSERGRAAIARMNQIHSRFEVANEDYLYVLSTFVFEPIRWLDRFGWRPMSSVERLALFHFWVAVGRRMGMRELPGSYEQFERFNIDYEKTYFCFTEAARQVGSATLEMFAGWFPRPLRFLVRRSMYAVMEEPLLDAFGFPRPWRSTRAVVCGALKSRAWFLRLLPARRKPLLRTQLKHPTYPEGYRIDELGPTVP
jgi:ER-bound oxygenase mpaB/B'/Rubber oxygenase, catalytic domain